jgi:general secretion pathway protein M
MSARLKGLWLARTPRERWLLGIMFALIALVLAWLLVLRPLDDMLSAARERHGNAVFQLSQRQPPGPGRVAIAIGAARPQALFGWVAGLETQGYVVERLSVSSNPDRTLSAQIVLRARGG